ncbi:MAG TPA: leucyl aminopeptidase [Rhizobiaceae bacterium]|nr:leucyl aminopeptidase [Rhizobiaceae bacterium]
MSPKIEISFSRSTKPTGAVAVLPVMEGSDPAAIGNDIAPADAVAKAIAIAKFKGKSATDMDILAPAGSTADRLLLVGAGRASERGTDFWIKLGGTIRSAARGSEKMVVYLDGLEPAAAGADAADLALGMLLKGYSFDRYKTRKSQSDKSAEADKQKVTIVTSAAAAAKKAFVAAAAVAAGVNLARDLVNEPANHLGPVEFAAKAKELEKLGVEVEILTEREMRKLGMGALLGVAQGSVRPPRLGIMRWNGGKPKQKPVAFIGKGVVFDTGGISMKPASGMEDMKGDMAGAAAVTGLMHVLAVRKAAVNAVGVIGLVENMPDGNAQRPGDVVTSMSGQTIEVLNTDAEGRLVLADALWYCAERFQPRFMVDLATLTGAVMVALGKYYAGLFSNDDALAENLAAAGLETGERVWRMPLGPEYDKLIDSRTADMKNIGGRHGGAIIAAQFLQRFVRDTPWAHLDIAGTALGSPANEINDSWGSGFGVRLLDRLVRDHYEG